MMIVGEIVGKGLSRVARKQQFLCFVSLLYFPSFPPSLYMALGTVAMEIPGFHKNRAVVKDQRFVSSTPPICILPHPRSTCCMSLILARTHINNSTLWPDCWLAACVGMSFRWKTVRPKPQLPLRGNKINCHDSCYVTPVFILLLLSDLP